MVEFSFNEIIELAIQTEKRGYDFYNASLSRKDLSDPVIELITFLRDEELIHEKKFKKMRDAQDHKDLGDLVNWQEAAYYLKTIADSHIFKKPDAAIQLAAKSSNEIDILQNSITFEKDTLLFFYSIKNEVKNKDVRKKIDPIINEELAHITKLKKLLNEITH